MEFNTQNGGRMGIRITNKQTNKQTKNKLTN